MKNELRQLIAADKIEQVLEKLEEIASYSNDQDFKNTLTLLQARHKEQRKNLILKNKTTEELEAERGQLRLALLAVLDEYNLEAPTIPALSPSSPKLNLLWLGLGVSFVLLSLVSVFLLPCPSSAQYTVFRTLLSLGVAGLVAMLPLIFDLQAKLKWSVGLFLSLFLLIYVSK